MSSSFKVVLSTENFRNFLVMPEFYEFSTLVCPQDCVAISQRYFTKMQTIANFLPTDHGLVSKGVNLSLTIYKCNLSSS